MEYSVFFRDFEDRDIDFVYKCKNDEKINSMVVGKYRSLSLDDAAKWVHGCMGDHETYKFWAICTKDNERRIIGWVSLSEIDRTNRSLRHYSIVLGDNEYNDGTIMFEAMLFSLSYAFDVLDMHRVYGNCISAHKITPHLLNAFGFIKEGVQRDAIIRNGRFYNVTDYAILQSEFVSNRNNGFYDLDALTDRFVLSVKNSRKK